MDLLPLEGSGAGPLSEAALAGFAAVTAPGGTVSIPNLVVLVLVAAALGGVAGWLLQRAGEKARERARVAYESEVARAAGCGRDRAVRERDEIAEQLKRLRSEHDGCGTRLAELIERLGDQDAAIGTLLRDLAEALEANDHRHHRIRGLEEQVADLESTRARREVADDVPSWLTDSPEGGKDDLTAIHGLGRSLEKRLNKLGIYRFRQLAQMTPANAQWIAARIRVVPGRILDEDWAAQARRITETGTLDETTH